MDVLQLSDTDLCIDRRGIKFGVTQHRLDKAHIRTVFQHQGGAGLEVYHGYRLPVYGAMVDD